jgi:hypothetical protein
LINSTNGFGSDGSSVTIYSSGGFAFRNSTLTTTLYSVDSAGSMSTNGTIYPGGGLNTIGTVTANSVVANSFTEGGVLLSNKYITSAALDTTYLRLNGANDMTGKLGIINSGLNTPQLGDYGGTGDRIILWKGGGGYPYSLGMNGNTMWYSVPNAIHNFYVNGTSRYQISSTGATLTGDLTVTGSITSGSTNNCFLGGLRINGSDTGNTLYNGTNSIGITALNSVHISTGTSLANYAQRLTVNTSGNVNITNSLSIDNKQIYDYLFNSTGFTHNSIGDFNNISSFGYRFIFNSTNGPGTQGTLNQFYSWYIGLGSEYSGSQYGCQFAIPRDITNPTLSIRFKEANNWKAWTGITANALKGTATFNVDYWHLSADGQKRLNFGNNGTTYFGTGGTTLAYVFRNPDDNSDIVKIDTNGSIRTIRALYCEGSFGLYLNVTTNNYWNIQSGVTPTGVVNSLLFYHLAIGINSVWWLSGTQTNTQADLSDKRSKYNIEDFTALETIEKLKPKSFDVIDDKDVKFQYGFIAQDIEEIPELKKLVFTEPNYVANINSYGTRRNDGNGCIITANDDLTGKIEVGDELKLVSDNNDKDNQEFILDATPYHNRYKRRYAKITEIISPTEFKVDCEINKLCCNDDDPFLIYGKKVEDAKSLDYNSFIALNTKAIQELYDIIKKQQEQINLLHEDYVRLLSKIQLE